jgi:hypothetical protein
MKPCVHVCDENYMFACDLLVLERFKNNDYLFGPDTFNDITELNWYISKMKKYNIDSPLVTEIEAKFNPKADNDDELEFLLLSYETKYNDFKKRTRFGKSSNHQKESNMLLSILFKIHELSNKDNEEYHKKYLNILTELLQTIK